MSEQDLYANRGQVVSEQNSSVAEGRFNENGVGGPFLVMDDSHPHVKITGLVAQGLERMKDTKEPSV
jgi:hypothetical protein